MKLGGKQSTMSTVMFIKTFAVSLLTIAIYSKLFINIFMAANNECSQYWCTQFTQISAERGVRATSLKITVLNAGLNLVMNVYMVVLQLL